MIILRLFSLIFTLCGLAVLVAAVWLLMGNKLTVPDSEMFGPRADAVQRLLPVEAAAPAAEARTAERAPAGDDGLFSPQMMPSVRGFDAPPAPSFAETMREVPIAYASPKTAQFARPFEVAVSIDGTGDDSAADALSSDANVTEDTALVTDRVRAAISGSSFDIEALSPDIQKISPLTENVWRWRVTAKAGGDQELTVELFGFEGEDALPIRTYRDTVTVEVTRVGQAIAIAEDANPLAMFLGGIGSVLAGFFGFVRFFRGS